MSTDLFTSTKPLTVLRPSTKACLNNLMNTNGVFNPSSNHFNNYIGLAELAGLGRNAIDEIEQSDKPTDAILDKWTEKEASRNGRPGDIPATIGTLWKFLHLLGRDDVIETTKDLVYADINCDEGDEVYSTDDLSYEEAEMAEILPDHATGQQKTFDAFAVFDDEIQQRIWPIVELLEEEAGLKIFYKPRDMPVGVANYPAQAYIIEKRCKQLLCFITSTFMGSADCSFIVRFVQSLSPDGKDKKIIPFILDKGAELPNILAPLVKLSFTDMPVEEFPKCFAWPRLLGTVKSHSRPVAEISPITQSESTEASSSSSKSLLGKISLWISQRRRHGNSSQSRSSTIDTIYERRKHTEEGAETNGEISNNVTSSTSLWRHVKLFVLKKKTGPPIESVRYCNRNETLQTEILSESVHVPMDEENGCSNSTGTPEPYTGFQHLDTQDHCNIDETLQTESLSESVHVPMDEENGCGNNTDIPEHDTGFQHLDTQGSGFNPR